MTPLEKLSRTLAQKKRRIALKGAGSSNTTRSKVYNKNGVHLDLTPFNHIEIDVKNSLARAETRVTMEALVKATLAQGLMPPVVPEFKGITVGGAIMGGAAESGSHAWGIFSDTCRSYDVITGDGTLLRASAHENASLFHALPGSYGSLGLLVSAEIALIPAPPAVHLRYHPTSNPVKNMLASNAHFVDGIVFDKEHAVVIEGNFSFEKPTAKKWYFEQAKKEGEVVLPLYEYLFRYDPGAFWMGAYLFNIPFISRFIGQGLLKLPSQPYFTQKEIERMHFLPSPSRFWLNRLPSQRLWKLLHKAESWVQDRLVIQDCCMPASSVEPFLHEIIEELGVFPLWLCPIKEAGQEQLFAPHSPEEPIVNVGIYGLPAISAPMEQITRTLEERIYYYGGRKVLYSRSCYTVDEFWKIYDEKAYRSLRHELAAEGVWPCITEKVLSK